MKKYLILLLMISFLSSCGNHSTKSPEPGRPGDVLILATQGVDPSMDTVGFNNLVKNVTQAFSDEFSLLLVEKDISHNKVIDQRTDIDSSTKATLYALHHAAKMILLLSIETETKANDERLLLRVQYVEIRPSQKEDVAFVAGAVLSKDYLLRSSVSGDNPKTIVDLAYDFMALLNENGKLK